MNTPSTIIEYEDDLILSACEFRWSKGDKFAFIEAIAICAARKLPYPNWVRDQIDAAMSSVFKAVFPDASVEEGRPGLGISYLPEGSELADMKENFSLVVKEASKALCLKSNTHVLNTHINAVRDFHLAELTSMYADFIVDPRPRFDGTTNVKRDLEGALDISKNEWEKLEASDEELAEVNGHVLRVRTIPPICRMATFDVIDTAWDSYKAFFLADRIAKFEDDHGIYLGE
jgi:hypothetical protein